MDEMSTNTPAETIQAEGFGVRIRQAREAQGISLGDMAMRSRLSIQQLRAIESEDIEALPDAVYVRAFLRGIAQVLELDATLLVNDYVTRFCGGKGPATTATPAHGTCTECVINEEKPHRGLKRLIAFLLILLMGAGGWYVYNDFFTNRTTTVPPVSLDEKVETVEATTPAQAEASVDASSEQTANAPEPVVEKTEVAAPEVTAEAEREKVEPVEEAAKPVEATPEAPKAERPAHILSLGFEAKADCWVQVKNPAGQVLFTGIVKAGSPLTVEAPKGSSVVIGNATAMVLKKNGQAVSLTSQAKGVARLTL